MNKKIKVLTFNGTYLPGYKAGGPIRSIANMTERLREEFTFYIITKDRDFNENVPYKNIKIDDWNKIREEFVYYHSPRKDNLSNIMKLIKDYDFDIVYLNGFFSSYTLKYLLLRRMKLIDKYPTIILPRGDLSTSALKLKSFKKKFFIGVAKILGLYSGLVWQATSEHEARDIKKNFKSDIRVVNVGNLSSIPISSEVSKREQKKTGCLKIVFLSRITKMKNLKYALKVLGDLKENIEFNIYGPVSDKQYWKECMKLIEDFPQNINVNYHGSINNNEVNSTMKENHALFLPTLGENYGHVIVEALLAEIPILISDNTPWRNLEDYNVGWDISLDQPEEFQNKIRYLASLDEDEYSSFRKNTRIYIDKYIDTEEKINDVKELFFSTIYKI
ncbi:glycosyltransferase family 4 protein [Salinicoccus luteus]|uniref:glycosyltransferase family 4 protein n=1 Tax=Salinicoccus luteus TaxID=367840 RepID=UPI00068BFDD7|nr:glycosyltransferase [Salinicoccus luteus]